MAERRMFTKKVTDDDHFMSLSSSAQALYLHLMMAADDDGFCNQINASIFKAHASLQDLQALLENRYIYQFESGVIVIKHFRMSNALRKDRYTPTAFQEELAKLQLKDNGSYTLETDVVADWLPNGCQTVAERLPQVSIDKDREVKDISIPNGIDCQTEASDVESIVEMWNSLPSAIPKITKLVAGRTRYKMLRARMKEYSAADFETAIENIRRSDFLQGNNKNGWTITFDWFVKPNNFPKVLDGQYNNKRPQAQTADDVLRAIMRGDE